MVAVSYVDRHKNQFLKKSSPDPGLLAAKVEEEAATAVA
jgi:hypothetical protein